MAIGDDALAAGFAILSDTDPADLGAQEINRTRDYLAQTKAIIPASFPAIAALKFTGTPRSSGGMADDPDLHLNLDASSKYLILASIIYQGTNGMNYQFTTPTLAPGAGGGYSNGFAPWGQAGETYGYTWGQEVEATTAGATVLGMLIAGSLKTDPSDSGTFAFHWGPAASGHEIIVGGGSFLLAMKIP